MCAVRRLSSKCVVLLLLGAFPMLGQAGPANPPHAAPGKAAEKAAPARRTEAGPAVMPSQEPVAIAPLTPEQLPAEPPRVIYKNGQLTIDSQNSTLTAVLNAICRQIGAQLDMPPGAANDRVAVHFSGSARQAISALLDGSSLNYVIMGSPENPDGVQKVILTKVLPASRSTGQEPAAGANGPATAQSVAPPQYAQDKPLPATGMEPWCQLTPSLDECRPGTGDQTQQQIPPEQASDSAGQEPAAGANGPATAQSVTPPQYAQDKPFPATEDYGPTPNAKNMEPWCKLTPLLDECRPGTGDQTQHGKPQ